MITRLCTLAAFIGFGLALIQPAFSRQGQEQPPLIVQGDALPAAIQELATKGPTLYNEGKVVQLVKLLEQAVAAKPEGDQAFLTFDLYLIMGLNDKAFQLATGQPGDFEMTDPRAVPRVGIVRLLSNMGPPMDSLEGIDAQEGSWFEYISQADLRAMLPRQDAGSWLCEMYILLGLNTYGYQYGESLSLREFSYRQALKADATNPIAASYLAAELRSRASVDKTKKLVYLREALGILQYSRSRARGKDFVRGYDRLMDSLKLEIRDAS